MERLGERCSAKLFLVWGAYSIVVTVLWQMVGAAGLPEYLAWAMAAVLAAGALVETER
jgi:hypothetical protein